MTDTTQPTQDVCEKDCANCNCSGALLDLKGVTEHVKNELGGVDVDSEVVESTVIYKDACGVSVAHMEDKTTPPGHVYIMLNVASDDGVLGILNFQNGPVKEVGINGITSEGVLAALIHRTRILNENFPCKENELALDALQLAVKAFEARTKERVSRGVEGTNQV